MNELAGVILRAMPSHVEDWNHSESSSAVFTVREATGSTVSCEDGRELGEVERIEEVAKKKIFFFLFFLSFFPQLENREDQE